MAAARAITLLLSLFLSGLLAEALQAEKSVQKEAGNIPVPKHRLPNPPPPSAKTYVVGSRPAPKAQPVRKLHQGGSKTVDCTDHSCAVIWLGRKVLVMKAKLPKLRS